MFSPTRLAPGVWRLGQHETLDHHSYLLQPPGEPTRKGTASHVGDRGSRGWIWIDPGDREHFPGLAEQAERLVGDCDSIHLIVATGLSPGAVGALPEALELASRAVLLTNQETGSFLTVAGLDPARIERVERFRPGLRLAATGAWLQVIVNPYGQFTGAVLLFEPSSGCLFSGDLLAGVGSGMHRSDLSARAEDWPAVRRLQEQRMPCNAAVRWTLDRVHQLVGLRQICPSSGPLLRPPVLETFLERLAKLPVGADLLARREASVQVLT